MVTQSLTLKIGSLNTPVADERDASSSIGILSENNQSSATLSATSIGVSDHNSKLVLQIELNATARQLLSMFAEPTPDGSVPSSMPTTINLDEVLSSSAMLMGSQNRMWHSIKSEYRQLKQKWIETGRIQACRQFLQRLSPRELDVLVLMMQARSCKEIAARLQVGLATAAKHRNRIFKKLNVRNTVELVQIVSAVFDEGDLTDCHSREPHFAYSRDGKSVEVRTTPPNCKDA